MPRAAVSHKHLSVINQKEPDGYLGILEYFSRSNGSPNQVFPRPQSELARCLEDNELPEFLEVLGAAQEVGYNLDEHYGKEVANYFFEFFQTFLPENPMKLLCRSATRPFCTWPLMRMTLTPLLSWKPALRWRERHLCLQREYFEPMFSSSFAH